MSSKKIGRYEIRSELGRGGMATVYLAYDPVLEREVALKVLPTYFAHEPEFSARFAREAKTVAALEHNAIVSMYDYGEDGEWPYFVMQLMKGGSLKEKIEQGPLNIAEAVKILKRIGSALDRAHSRNLIHRDLKPGNILFNEDGDAYLTDFGIVKIAEASDNYTQTGNTLGTPAYMSPEQARGVEEIDGRSDIYALGVILYEMLTGDVPYKSDTTLGQAMMHVMDPLPEILSVNPDLPPVADEIIKKAMAKKQEDRYATASELATAVEAVAEGKTTADATTEVVTTPPKLETEPEPIAVRSPAPEPAAAPVTAVVPSQKEVTETTTAVTPPPPAKQGGIPTWAYAVAGLVVIAIIAVFALSGGDEGDGETTDNANGSQQVVAATSEPEPTNEPESTDAPEPTNEPEVDNEAGEISIAYDEAVVGFVAEDEVATYVFSGEARDLIDVTADALGDFDVVIELSDNNGRTVVIVNASSSGEERLPAFRLPDDDAYTISVYGLEGQSGGYELALFSLSNAANIASGLYGPGSIESADDEGIFPFYAEAGDTVRAIVESFAGLDAIIELYSDSTGEIVDTVDNYGTEAVEDLISTLPESDFYYFRVSNFEETVGEYKISLFGPATTVFQMNPDAMVEGDFKNSDFLDYFYIGEAGETITLIGEMSDEALDSFIDILDENRDLLSEDGSYTFTTDGELVIISVVNPAGSQGFFTLFVDSQ